MKLGQRIVFHPQRHPARCGVRSQLRRANRRGAAFLLLVFALLLVVTGATFQLVKSEWMVRRAQADTARSGMLLRAIEAVETSASEGQQPIRLPIDAQQWIDVEFETAEDGVNVTARWVRNGNLVDSISRLLEKR